MKRSIALMVLTLTAGCSSAPSEESKTTDPVALVTTAVATSGSATQTTELYGTVEAGAGGVQALVAPSESIVASVVAPTGTAVGAGALVATLRPSATAQLDLARASSDATAANAALARALRLRTDGLMSGADVDAAQATATASNATRASLAARSGALALRAPAAGTVQNLTARPGDLLASGTVVASVITLGAVRGRFGVDSTTAARVRPGQPLQVAPVAGGRAVATTVAGVDPQVDPTTRQAAVFAALPADAALGLGVSLKATITTGAPVQAITIPYTALLDDGGKPYVFVIERGVARRRDVVPGNGSGARVAITAGLAAGARVVTEGGTALEDGIKVRERTAK